MADSPRRTLGSHQGVSELALSAAELIAGRVPLDDAIGLLSGLLDGVGGVRRSANGPSAAGGELRRLSAEPHFVVHLRWDGWSACSENISRVVGCPADVSPRELLSFVCPEDRVAALRAYVETSTGRHTSYPVHLRLHTTDEPRPVLETMFVGMLSATGQRSVAVYGLELTGQRAETARLRELVSRLTDAVMVVDETGHVRLTNDALARMFGDRARRWTHQHEREALRALIAMCRDVPRSGQRLAVLARAREHRAMRLGLADGRLVEIDRTPLADADMALGALWQIREVTAEAPPERTRRSDPATRAATQHRVLASMTCELRGPLTAISNSAELLAGITAGRLPEAQQRAIEVISRNTGRLLRLIDDLQLLSRLESEQITARHDEVRVPELIDAVAADWTSSAAAVGISLACRTSHGAPLVGDTRYLRRVLDNLIHNALTFSPAGSTVAVSASPEGPQWTIAVTDHGIGIPATELTLIVHVFERGSNAVTAGLSGVGLGLPICRKLVELHHGTLNIESAVDIGTTVRVRLPILQGGRSSMFDAGPPST